jgi:multiple sugar transport system substrate-binding protein
MSKKNPTTPFSDLELDRRTFLKTSGASLAGLYGLNYFSPQMAFAGGEVKWLSWAHFITSSDKELKNQAKAFSKKTGTEVNIELIAHLQLPAKKASEAHAKSGHDVMQFASGDPELFKDLLTDVSDLAEELGRDHGGWLDFAKDICVKDGQWKGIPWAYNAYPLVVRSDLMEKAGISEGDLNSYDDLLAIGKKLKGMGHPVGFALSHAMDSLVHVNSMLWAFGAKMVEADSRTVAIDSSETAKTLEYAKKLYDEAMDPAVLEWDDASNNRFILSGKGSVAWNPPSIYWVAKVKEIEVDDQPIADLLDHWTPVEGPAGRFSSGYPWVLGIWTFANNPEGAKEFLRYIFASENYNNWLTAGDGYNNPVLREFEKHPVWDSDPKYRFAKKIGQYTRIAGWPGQPTEYSQIASDLYVLPDMFAYVASGTKSIPDAIKWADKELKLIYAGQKKLEEKKG